MDDKTIKEFLSMYSETLRNLGISVLCPACKQSAKPPFANLGESFGWAEGHPGCVPKESES